MKWISSKKILVVKPFNKTLLLLGSGSDYGSGASGAGTCFEPYTQVSILSHLQQNDNDFGLHSCYKLSPHKMFRSATALRFTATLDMTLSSAGMETTALTRYNLYPLGWIFYCIHFYRKHYKESFWTPFMVIASKCGKKCVVDHAYKRSHHNIHN